MKNTKIIFSFLTGVASTVLLFASCEKKTGYTIELTSDSTQTQSIIAADELNVSYEFDQAVNEALLATTVSRIASGDTASFPPGNVLYTTLSKVSIDTNESNIGLIKMRYAGINADNTKSRTDSIKIKLAVENGKVIPWKTQGATATISFINYEVNNIITNKQLRINGACKITNVTGGLLKKATDLKLQPGDSLVDKLSANLTFTYNDNIALIKTWTWNLNQQRSFVLNDTIISASVTGDTIVNSLENVSTMGINRFEENFYTDVTTPVLQNISGLFLLSDPLSGSKAINGIPKPILIIYGVTEQGSIENNDNPYGYKIVWTNSSGERQQFVVKY